MLTQEDLDNINVIVRRAVREEVRGKEATENVPAALTHPSPVSPAPRTDEEWLTTAAQNLANAHKEDALVITQPFQKMNSTEHIPYLVLASQANTWEKANCTTTVHPEKS